LAIFDGAKPNQSFPPSPVTIARFVHSRLVGSSNQLAPSLSLGIFEKEDCLWMSMTPPTTAPRIAAFSPDPRDRPDGQFATGRQKTDQAAPLPLQS